MTALQTLTTTALVPHTTSRGPSLLERRLMEDSCKVSLTSQRVLARTTDLVTGLSADNQKLQCALITALGHQRQMKAAYSAEIRSLHGQIADILESAVALHREALARLGTAAPLEETRLVTVVSPDETEVMKAALRALDSLIGNLRRDIIALTGELDRKSALLAAAEATVTEAHAGTVAATTRAESSDLRTRAAEERALAAEGRARTAEERAAQDATRATTAETRAWAAEARAAASAQAVAHSASIMEGDARHLRWWQDKWNNACATGRFT